MLQKYQTSSYQVSGSNTHTEEILKDDVKTRSRSMLERKTKKALMKIIGLRVKNSSESAARNARPKGADAVTDCKRKSVANQHKQKKSSNKHFIFRLDRSKLSPATHSLKGPINTTVRSKRSEAIADSIRKTVAIHYMKNISSGCDLHSFHIEQTFRKSRMEPSNLSSIHERISPTKRNFKEEPSGREEQRLHQQERREPEIQQRLPKQQEFRDNIPFRCFNISAGCLDSKVDFSDENFKESILEDESGSQPSNASNYSNKFVDDPCSSLRANTNAYSNTSDRFNRSIAAGLLCTSTENLKDGSNYFPSSCLNDDLDASTYRDKTRHERILLTALETSTACDSSCRSVCAVSDMMANSDDLSCKEIPRIIEVSDKNMDIVNTDSLFVFIKKALLIEGLGNCHIPDQYTCAEIMDSGVIEYNINDGRQQTTRQGITMEVLQTSKKVYNDDHIPYCRTTLTNNGIAKRGEIEDQRDSKKKNYAVRKDMENEVYDRKLQHSQMFAAISKENKTQSKLPKLETSTENEIEFSGWSRNTTKNLKKDMHVSFGDSTVIKDIEWAKVNNPDMHVSFGESTIIENMERTGENIFSASDSVSTSKTENIRSCLSKPVDPSCLPSSRVIATECCKGWEHFHTGLRVIVDESLLLLDPVINSVGQNVEIFLENTCSAGNYPVIKWEEDEIFSID